MMELIIFTALGLLHPMYHYRHRIPVLIRKARERGQH